MAERDQIVTFAKGLAEMVGEKPTDAEIAEAQRQLEEQLAIADRMIAERGGLFAPKGQPSKLNRHQWAQVRTANFKRWFGDWEDAAEIDAMQKRVAEWLSPANLEKAKGKTRAEIFAEFGNDLEPVSFLPAPYLKYFADSSATDNRVYSGKGYFIDHAVNNHPDIDVERYGDIQGILNNPDEVIVDRRPDAGGSPRDNLLFVKSIGKNYLVTVQLGADANGKVVLHKSLATSSSKKPYPKLARIGLAASGGGMSPISHADESAPGGSLSARDAVEGTVTRQVRQVNPESVSKVVDDNGEPLVVYRYAKNEEGIAADVRFFTKNADYAEAYFEEAGNGGGLTAPAYLSLKNPVVANMESRDFSDPAKESPYIRAAIDGPQDGVIFKDAGGIDELYAALDANQIKSATSNAGTFSGETDNILHQPDGGPGPVSKKRGSFAPSSNTILPLL